MEFPVLCIDHGMKFIGLAISRSGHFADPLNIIKRKSRAADFAKLNEMVRQHKVRSILLGLPPVPPDFVGHSQADSVIKWAGRLARVLPLPIYLWDEGLSSEDATTLLREAGQNTSGRIDAHAAAVILQTCLDALREGTGAPTLFEATTSATQGEEESPS